jgi:hypothetical protein
MSRMLRCTSLVLGLVTMAGIPRVSLAQRGASARGSAPAAVTPMTDVSITLGTSTVTGRVDANCHVDERATTSNTRAYFVAMYPWFGQRVAPDKPQWRFDLEIRRGTASEASDQFVFSFLDGQRSGTIQTVSGSERMGSGTVRVTRHGTGARFEVTGRTKEGDALRATIDCSAFQKSEGAGGFAG